MPMNAELFERELKLAVTVIEPEAIRKELAGYARKSVAEVIGSGLAPAEYDRYVNGRLGESEDSVQLPGPIVYIFQNWRLVINTAIEELQKRVPRRSGRYAASFIATVNGTPVINFDEIENGAEVIIINAQPYTRKMESGANKTGKRHFDLSKAALNRRFRGAFNAQVAFLNVTAGIDPRVPYVLKRSAGKRKDRQAGVPITYPALMITSE
jgi:hypothetical protein